jgi:dephospho-CoA kinase
LKVVGVTGKYCSGKDTAVQVLVDHGYVELNMDQIGHEALKSERDRIVARFGSDVLDAQGGINRRILGARVFAQIRELRALESIVHPVMVDTARERIIRVREEGSSPGVVINAALLYRMGLHTLCDTVIYVDAPFRMRLERARKRDRADLLGVMRRLRSQQDVAPQFFGPDADVLSVQNDGSQEQLRAKLERLLSLP